MQDSHYDILQPHEPGLEYGENAADIAADVMAAHIAAAPAIGSHVGETRGVGEADLQAPHASVSAEALPRDRSVSRVMEPQEPLDAYTVHALEALLTDVRSGTITAPPSTEAPPEACNVVAIALLRVALTAYESAIGPLVKARAKSKCAVLH